MRQRQDFSIKTTYINTDTSGSDTFDVARQTRVANRCVTEAMSIQYHPLSHTQAMWEKETWFGYETSTTCTVCAEGYEGGGGCLVL